MRLRLLALGAAAVVTATLAGPPELLTMPASAVVAVSAPASTAAQVSAAAPSLDYSPDPSWWGTNGRVVDIATSGNRVYIAGGFDYVGPQIGHGIAVNSSGTRYRGFPMIDGKVFAAAPDGNGGWYIGGEFTHVGGVYRPRAAQITADGKLTDWDPRPNNAVLAIAVSSGSVILGGSFTTVGRTPVTAVRLAAVDQQSGVPVTGWRTSLNAAVRTLVLSGGSVFVGGDFTTVNGVSRRGLIRVNATTGAVEWGFVGRTGGGSVWAAALSPDGTRVYVGGAFTYAYGGRWTPRSRLAAFSTSTGSLLSWAPRANWTVRTMASDPTTGSVYAGGYFDYVSGAYRNRLVGLSPTGSVLSFNAGIAGCHAPHTTKDAHTFAACAPEVSALVVSGRTLYVGGRFGWAARVRRHDAAAFSLSSGGLASWNPVASDRPLTLAASGSSMFLGGDLTSVNGTLRRGVAALDATTGAVDPAFYADTNNMVLDLAFSPDKSRLYLGGHFTTVRGVARSHLASVVPKDGTPDSRFHPTFDNDVLSIGVGNSSLYVGGQFTKVNGWTRKHLVRLSLVYAQVYTGFRADTWGPSGALRNYGMVETVEVAPDGSKVYFGGPFDTVNGAARKGLAVVAGLSGSLLGSQLGGIMSCSGGRQWIVQLRLSPDGKRLYGGDVCPDWIYQWDAVNLSAAKPYGLNWKTLCNAGMQGALEVGDRFYYGTHGGNTGSGGWCWATPKGGPVAQQRYFVFDQAGTLLPDRPSFDTPMGVWTFTAIGSGLLVGGDFTYAGDSTHVHQGLALFPGTP